ncbi:response regulator transcription factor [Spirosoma harenae]
MPPLPIRIVIVEDNELFRKGLKALLDFSPQFTCVGDYSSGVEALADIRVSAPDVVLMDIDLPEKNGIDCTRELKATELPFPAQVIILTVLEEETKVLEAIMAGASGYLLKSASPEQIMDGIRQVMNAGSPMSPGIARKVLGLVKGTYASPKNQFQLNKRELEVLEGLVEGLTYKMIGEKYFIAVDTVRTYIRSIYEKLQVHSRSEAIVKAMTHKLV